MRDVGIAGGAQQLESGPYLERRRRALLAATLFLVFHPLFTLAQALSVATVVKLPDFVVPSVFWWSIATSLIMDAVVIGFLCLNWMAPKRAWDGPKLLFLSTLITSTFLILGWIAQLHIGGSQTSHMLSLLLGTLVAVSWFMPPLTILLLTGAATLAAVGVVALEALHVIPYSPMVHIGAQAEQVFLHPLVLATNALIYGCTFAFVLLVTLRLQQEAKANRNELRRKNTLLEAEIQQRERVQTTLRRAVQELTDARDRQRQVMQATAHDMRSPLTAIGGFASLLQDRLDDSADAKTKAHLERIVGGVEMMRHLVDDLSELVLGQSEAVRLEPCDAGLVFGKVLGLMEARIRDTSATIKVEQLPVIMADERRLTRVFQNLLSNALKFRTQAAPVVRVGADWTGWEWEFFVRDNGIGFDSTQADRPFQPFERLVTKEQYSGTGVGLAVCKTAIEAMGGRIWAQSTPGQGATFRFTLSVVPIIH